MIFITIFKKVVNLIHLFSNEKSYAHLSGQLSENFRDQLMQIVILNIENDRLHRILREGIEENKILKNRSDKLMSDKGFEIV